jgi:hypothetical protein
VRDEESLDIGDVLEAFHLGDSDPLEGGGVDLGLGDLRAGDLGRTLEAATLARLNGHGLGGLGGGDEGEQGRAALEKPCDCGGVGHGVLADLALHEEGLGGVGQRGDCLAEVGGVVDGGGGLGGGVSHGGVGFGFGFASA